MVDAFRRLGADAHGLDISENSIAFARRNFPGCTFYCEDFDAMAQRGLRFDFLFTTELLEHLPGPHDVMRFLAGSAKPGAVVYAATPDAGHPAVPEDFLSWGDICPPEHLQWFDRDNLARLFDDYGFDLLRQHRKKTPALSMLFKKRVE